MEITIGLNNSRYIISSFDIINEKNSYFYIRPKKFMSIGELDTACIFCTTKDLYNLIKINCERGYITNKEIVEHNIHQATKERFSDGNV